MKVRLISPPQNSHLYLLSFSSWSSKPPQPRPPKRTASDEIKPNSDPSYQGLCHCDDCKKISGGAYSVNVVVPDKDFEASGPMKKISKTADSKNEIHSYFCSECGTTLYRDGPSFPGLKIIKAGVLDKNGINEIAKPDSELFAPLRATWLPALDGADQKQTMS